MILPLSDHVREVLRIAERDSNSRKLNDVSSRSLALALLSGPDGIATRLLGAAPINFDTLAKEINRTLPPPFAGLVESGGLKASPEVSAILERATNHALARADGVVETGDVLAATLEVGEPPIIRAFEAAGVNIEEYRKRSADLKWTGRLPGEGDLDIEVSFDPSRMSSAECTEALLALSDLAEAFLGRRLEIARGREVIREGHLVSQ